MLASIKNGKSMAYKLNGREKIKLDSSRLNYPDHDIHNMKLDLSRYLQ